MIRYIITTHDHLDGVGLSKLGHWGNIRHPNDAIAERAARKDAAGRPHTIERQTKRLRRL